MSAGRIEAYFTVPSSTTVSASNDGGGPTSVSLTAGVYTITSFLVHLIARCNAVRTGGTWSGSVSTGTSGTGLVTLNCTGSTWALTFTTAAVGTVLGIVGNIAARSSAYTGTQNARGLWLPDCPLWTEMHPSMGPKETDAVSTESPTGFVITNITASKRVHTMLRYSHVVESRYREAAGVAAGYTYRTLEQWLDDTQFGDGHAWFLPGSAFQVYWDNAGTDALLGVDLNSGTGATDGWRFSPPVGSMAQAVKRVDQAWNGMWAIEFARIASEG